MPNRIRIGTRGSALALWQSRYIAEQLQALDWKVELIEIATQGDRNQSGPLSAIGGQGLFTKEIQHALLRRDVDLAVHSLKDLPTEPTPGLRLAATPQRAPDGDALVSNKYPSFKELPPGAMIGTGSRRRQSQLWHARPDLKLVDVRGNVDTRLRKLDEGQYDALILAEAGLRRLGFADRIAQVLPKELILPAVGQGALGLEIREDDQRVATAVTPLNHRATFVAVAAERALLFTLRGGCLAPIGAWARVEVGHLRLSAVVLSPDGRSRLAAEDSALPEQAAALGESVAHKLLAQGAAELIAAGRSV